MTTKLLTCVQKEYSQSGTHKTFYSSDREIFLLGKSAEA